MDDDTKRAFDAFTSLRDHAWAEFLEKVRVEWRLSFGLWAALLAIAGAILNASDKLKGASEALRLFAIIVAPAVAVLHLIFLVWIQSRLRAARHFLWKAQDQMWTIAGHPGTGSAPPDWPWWHPALALQPALWVQLAITIMLGVALNILVFSLQFGPLG